MNDDKDTAERLRAAYERYAEHEPSALAAIGLRDLLGRALDLLDEERARCSAWVERVISVLPDDIEKRPLYHVSAGIKSGEWPPKEG